MFDKIAHPEEVRGSNVGIMGITADPPHRGHRELIAGVLACNRFTTVVLYPTGEQRDDKTISAGPNDRAAMLMQTLNPELFGYPTKLIVVFADMYGKNTYTIKLLQAYQKRFPDKHFS